MIVVEKPGAPFLVVGAPLLHRAHLGVSAGGPADPLAAAVANRLVDNRPDAPVLEVPLVGPTLRFEENARIALAGAPFTATLDDEPVPLAAAVDVKRGQRLALGRCARGVRLVLAARGGLNLDEGSGRRLVGAGLAPSPSPPPPAPPHLNEQALLRVTPGAQRAWFDDETWAALVAAAFRVRPDSDRRGVRLDDHALRVPRREMASEGVTAGAVQVPPSGRPVILGVDQQTTGGYPVIAHVVSADRWRLGQLRPGDVVRFAPVGFDEARALWLAWRREWWA
jgi:allophanate hydrolase subunit 2